MALIDTYGRRINYLRLSVTDRCNMRCCYCMPAQGVAKLEHKEMLSYEELYRVSAACVAQGIEKIRVTGGEPLVRRGLVDFLGRLSALPGLKELVLTTNGLLLEELARPLKEAGVARLNISLDSLQPETFARITRGADLNRVLAGIEAAEQAGFGPLKINMVVMRGVNDQEILDFAALTLEKPFTVRFIEYMPTLKDEGWGAQSMPGSEILAAIGERYPLLPLVSSEMAGPARNYKIQGASGAIGIITPVSGHFCESCNRIRITATGRVRGCLFSDQGTELKPLLASGDPEALEQTLRRIVTQKPGRHHIAEEGAEQSVVNMSRIGG
ncbi:GTP 3',8-cyclase MoaA [Geomonas sp. Red69]|uniref:GTP 3',8-cyclase n=1 Tax=Geomonas diazotrophica TaxID=2843197 RepID=A0ABX8JGE3_9BACT|nr:MULTISPECIES: GTP 3',8-cyclase MoaA [Geomonas]MBU5637672.1 GTP 3',8-cyclase MoaA [Geomonas diazotrophica]QWV96211.1 GTP 3',8-cyclase MoaA [Geomonas nitrogeniifigens]QXE85278.1 GTP 3',8-cyclase MoaA [Geomonas nitrogeniifigens]